MWTPLMRSRFTKPKVCLPLRQIHWKLWKGEKGAEENGRQVAQVRMGKRWCRRGWGRGDLIWLIWFDFFIERMTVLGLGLVFQLVLVIQTCTYSSNNIITLQNIDITDFPSKFFFFFKKNIPTPPPHNPTPPKPTPTTKEATILANVLTCH